MAHNIYSGLSVETVIELIRGYASTGLSIPKDLREHINDIGLNLI